MTRRQRQIQTGRL